VSLVFSPCQAGRDSHSCCRLHRGCGTWETRACNAAVRLNFGDAVGEECPDASARVDWDGLVGIFARRVPRSGRASCESPKARRAVPGSRGRAHALRRSRRDNGRRCVARPCRRSRRTRPIRSKYGRSHRRSGSDRCGASRPQQNHWIDVGANDLGLGKVLGERAFANLERRDHLRVVAPPQITKNPLCTHGA
jgi:hypothetical protein